MTRYLTPDGVVMTRPGVRERLADAGWPAEALDTLHREWTDRHRRESKGMVREIENSMLAWTEAGMSPSECLALVERLYRNCDLGPPRSGSNGPSKGPFMLVRTERHKRWDPLDLRDLIVDGWTSADFDQFERDWPGVTDGALRILSTRASNLVVDGHASSLKVATAWLKVRLGRYEPPVDSTPRLLIELDDLEAVSKAVVALVPQYVAACDGDEEMALLFARARVSPADAADAVRTPGFDRTGVELLAAMATA